MLIVCIGETRSRSVNTCVCDAACRSVSQFAAIQGISPTSRCEKTIKDLTRQSGQAYIETLRRRTCGRRGEGRGA